MCLSRIKTLFHLSLYLTQSLAYIRYSVSIPWVIKWAYSLPSFLILPFHFLSSLPLYFLFFFFFLIPDTFRGFIFFYTIISDGESKTNLILGKRHIEIRIKKRHSCKVLGNISELLVSLKCLTVLRRSKKSWVHLSNTDMPLLEV